MPNKSSLNHTQEGERYQALMTGKLNRGYLFFSVKDRNLFYRVETIGNIFRSGAATSENITDGVLEIK